MALETGRIIDQKYRIVRLIGEGGMGEVYEAENARIRRRVALKVLRGAFAQRADAIQRFEREAQAAGSIGNDHVLEVLDLGTLPEGDFYMVMELLDGEPLSRRIERLGRLDARDAALITRQILAGLEAAHAAGIIHRDLKPDNIFVLRQKAGQRDFVKIIDFGISKFTQLTDSLKMTQTGAFMGTPLYLSPELASGSRPADARSDLYAVGVILYEAVTGDVPFQSETLNQLLFKIALSDAPSPLSVAPDLDPELAAIISKAMMRNIEERYQTASEFDAALQAWLRERHGVSIADGVVPAPVALPAAQMNDAGAAAQTNPVLAVSVDPAPHAGAATAAPWATSGLGATGAPRKRRLLPAAIAGASLLLVAGVAAYGITRGTTPSPASSESATTTAGSAPALAPSVAPASTRSSAEDVERAPALASAAPSVAPAIPSASQVLPVSSAPRQVAKSPPRRAPSKAKPPAKPPVKSTVPRDFGY